MRILVSACLLGVPCRYDGKSVAVPDVCRLAKEHTLIPICPEQLGGLPTPRTPSERQGDRVVNREGEDVTAFFSRGADQAVALAELLRIDLAILKQNSPSCGCGFRYDGTFSRTRMVGNGMTAERLLENGFTVISEDMANTIS